MATPHARPSLTSSLPFAAAIAAWKGTGSAVLQLTSTAAGYAVGAGVGGAGVGVGSGVGSISMQQSATASTILFCPANEVSNVLPEGHPSINLIRHCFSSKSQHF